ncbi:MAG: hypothetical protein JW884_14405 [Deltaproteobacteria bacterium]|nr:hypothetical protein [Deltaproteobacteria bacterium]
MKRFIARFFRDRKKLFYFVVLLVLFAAGLSYRFFPLIEEVLVSEEEIVIKEKQVEKYRQVIGSREDLQKRHDALQKSLSSMEAGFLNGSTPSLAAVDIQNVIDSIVRTSEVSVSTVRVMKTKDLDKWPYTKIPVQFSVNSNIRQLRDMLYSIQSSEKYLTIDDIKLSVLRRRNEDVIRADITVSGFIKKTAAAGK